MLNFMTTVQLLLVVLPISLGLIIRNLTLGELLMIKNKLLTDSVKHPK